MTPLAATLLACLSAPPGAMAGGRTPTIAEAIAMTRIQPAVAVGGEVAAFSPDGSRFAAVVWRGDHARNVNVHSLLVFRVDRPGAPEVVLSLDFAGDPRDQRAAPIRNVTFLGDNRTIVFLGRKGRNEGQLYAVDTVRKRLRELLAHPHPIRSYAAAPDGTLRLYSDAALAENGADGSVQPGGVFPADGRVFPQRIDSPTGLFALREPEGRRFRRYFLAGGQRLLFDSRRYRPVRPGAGEDPRPAVMVPSGTPDQDDVLGWVETLTPDPTGRYALLYPYLPDGRPIHPERYRAFDGENAYTRRLAAPYGLIDLRSGAISVLLSAPHLPFHRNGGRPVWAPDGRSVIIYSLLPLEGPEADARSRQQPGWVQVDLDSRRPRPLALPDGMRVWHWDAKSGTVVLRAGTSFATMTGRPDGTFGAIEKRGEAAGFNTFYRMATNGRVVVGVTEDLQAPPELAIHDLGRGATTVLSDLNPSLRRLRYGPVEATSWNGPRAGLSTGFLIRPPDQRPGARYPLVILLDDGMLGRSGPRFLLDGNLHLSGHPVQMLAAAGLVVLYTREPARLEQALETPEETRIVHDSLQSAISALDRQGLIDPARVGLAGWSRAGFWTDDMLMRGPSRFAAAVKIDGGSQDYLDRGRPFTDAELARLRTPLLFATHGPGSLVSHASMFDRLESMGHPVELLHLPSAPHAATLPSDRWWSLSVTLDWFRFWLQGHEDPDPAKKDRYSRWRTLRTRPEKKPQAQLPAPPPPAQ